MFRQLIIRLLLCLVVWGLGAGRVGAQSVPSLIVKPLVVVTPQDDGRVLHLALVGYFAAQGADLSTTMYALGSHTGHEANPAFALFTSSPWLAGAVKMGIAAGTSVALHQIHTTHPRLSFWLAIAGTVGYSTVAWHNSRVIRGTVSDRERR